DILLYVFGFSAWWWVVLCVFAVVWSFRRIEQVTRTDRSSMLVAGAGFGVLLLASSSLEALRLYTLKVALPMAPGGIFGDVVGRLLVKATGFTGATIILLITIAIGWSLFTGMSWIAVIERLGDLLERVYAFLLERWRTWQDRRVGAAAVVEREEI